MDHSMRHNAYRRLHNVYKVAYCLLWNSGFRYFSLGLLILIFHNLDPDYCFYYGIGVFSCGGNYLIIYWAITCIYIKRFAPHTSFIPNLEILKRELDRKGIIEVIRLVMRPGFNARREPSPSPAVVYRREEVHIERHLERVREQTHEVVQVGDLPHPGRPTAPKPSPHPSTRSSDGQRSRESSRTPKTHRSSQSRSSVPEGLPTVQVIEADVEDFPSANRPRQGSSRAKDNSTPSSLENEFMQIDLPAGGASRPSLSLSKRGSLIAHDNSSLSNSGEGEFMQVELPVEKAVPSKSLSRDGSSSAQDSPSSLGEGEFMQIDLPVGRRAVEIPSVPLPRRRSSSPKDNPSPSNSEVIFMQVDLPVEIAAEAEQQTLQPERSEGALATVSSEKTKKN